MRALSRRPPNLTSDRGQALPLVAILFALCAASAAVVVQIGTVLADEARAASAADAAALAAAAEGPDAAPELAERNGGVVEEVRWAGEVVTVVVRVGRAEATASARRE